MEDLLQSVTGMLQFLQKLVPLGQQGGISISNGLGVHLQILAVSLRGHQLHDLLQAILAQLRFLDHLPRLQLFIEIIFNGQVGWCALSPLISSFLWQQNNNDRPILTNSRGITPVGQSHAQWHWRGHPPTCRRRPHASYGRPRTIPERFRQLLTHAQGGGKVPQAVLARTQTNRDPLAREQAMGSGGKLPPETKGERGVQRTQPDAGRQADCQHQRTALQPHHSRVRPQPRGGKIETDGRRHQDTRIRPCTQHGPQRQQQNRIGIQAIVPPELNGRFEQKKYEHYDNLRLKVPVSANNETRAQAYNKYY